MNHIYRTVFNRAVGVYQVASELATGNGKAGSASKRCHAALPLLLLGMAGTAQAGDINTVYINGSGSLTYTTAANITQSTALNVNGLTNLNTGGGAITLTNANNLFDGAISLAGANAQIASSYSIAFGNLSLDSLAATTTSGYMNLGGGTILGALNASSTAQMFQTTGLTVGGTTTLNAGGFIDMSSASNDFGGIVNASAGIISIRDMNNLQMGTVTNGTNGSVNLIAGGTLTLNQALNTGTSNINLASYGGGLSLANALQGNLISLTASAGMTISGPITSSSGVTLASPGSVLVSGVIGGAGDLTLNTAGVSELTGNNTYQGGTNLNFGTLIAGTNTALGSGTLTAAANTRLEADTAIALANNVTLNGNLTTLTVGDLTLNGAIGGSGGLTKFGAGYLTLNGNNNFIGNVALNSGGLVVGSSSALGAATLNAQAGTTLTANAPVSIGNAVNLVGNMTVTGVNNLTLGGVVNGFGGLTKNDLGNLRLNGNNGYQGNTTLNAGTLTLGNANALGSGSLVVGGAATLDNSAAFGIGNSIVLNAGLTVAGNNDLSFNGVVSGAGSLTKNGLSDLTLAGNNTFSGALNIASGSVTTLNANALGDTGSVNISAGAGLNLGSNASAHALSGSGNVQLTGSNTLTVGGVNSDSTFDGDLSGTGGLTKVGTGTLNLTGINSITGTTQINAGTLNLSGSLGSSQVTVGNGGTLTGTGSLIGNVQISNGGHLALASGDTLSASSLQLSTTSNLDVALGIPASTSLLNVGGNVTLDGNLNVTDAGGFGTGVYRLINYTGGLIDNGLNVNAVPVGYALGDLVVQTGTANQVNLLVSAPGAAVLFWDGSQNIADGNVGGGTGTWSVGGTNWTEADGLTNHAWGSTFAVFTGTAGTVTVNGTQSFTGLQFVTDGYTLTGGQLSAVNGSGGATNIRVDPNSTATIASTISGSGTLNKLDTGTLVLSGNNTYTGGTQLTGGTLVVGSNSALGSGSLTVVGASMLDSSSAVTLAGTPVVLNANLSIGGSNNLALGGVISGTGGLIKDGSANLTLTGANTYQGGTTVNGGTLTVGNATALGGGAVTVAGAATLANSTSLTLTNDFTLNGSLTLSGSSNLALSGILAGTGTLIKNGAADLTLSGNNTFSGDLNVQGGSLTLVGTNALGTANLNVGNTANVQVAGDSTFDALSGDGDLAIGAGNTLSAGASNANSVYDGNLTGAGSFAKLGTGKLVFNGNSSLGGGTSVNAGSLIIGGASGSSASLTSDVAVANGATLGGHGTITGDVDVNSGGTLAPGNSIGTLSVVGNVTLASGSLFEVEANPDGTSDRLTATGDVTLNGATLSLIAANGSWAPSTSYTIISANNVIGTFATPIVSNLAFLDANVAYSSGNSVVLNLLRNDVSFSSVAVTRNQVASSTAVASLGAGNALNLAVSGLSAAGAQAAYDSLSGELHASLQSALLDDSRYLREGVNERLLAAQGLTASSGVLNASADGPTFWLQGYGGWARNDGDGNAARLDHDSKGTLFGGDIALNDTWRVGAAVGLGTTDVDQNDRDSSADVDSQSVALYASAKWDQVNLRLGAGRTWNEIDSRRQVNVGALNEREKTSYDATVTQVFSEVGYRLTVDQLQLEPFIGLAHVQFDGDSFHEKGGSAALSGNGEKQDITYSTLGLRGSVPLAQVAGLPVSAQGGLSWQHAFGGDTPDSRLSFAGGDTFQVQGTPMERNSALAELGVQAQVAANTTVGLTYSGRFGEDYRDNGVRLALNVGF